jgi:hypothetical protein
MEVWGESMDDNFKKALADFFTAQELVDFLEIPVEDIIELFEEDIKDFEDDLKDEMNYKDNDKDDE